MLPINIQTKQSCYFENKNDPHITFGVKWGYLIKKALYHSYQVQNMKTTYRKSWPENLFQMFNFTFDLFFNVKWGHLTSDALYLP